MDNPIDLDKLDRVITQRGTNVTALAAKIGHDRVVVSGWKNGRRIPTLESALRLAKGLGVPVEDICHDVVLPGDPNPEPTNTDPNEDEASEPTIETEVEESEVDDEEGRPVYLDAA